MIFRIVFAFLVFNGATAGFIDMDTPLNKRTTTSLIDGSTYHLVSDAFFACIFFKEIAFLELSHIRNHLDPKIMLSCYIFYTGHVGRIQHP